MTKIRAILAAAAITAASSVAIAAPADASPAGCGAAHFVNNAPITQSVGSSTWRIGTLTQYWGWCNSNLRNWAHVHFSAGNSAFGTRVAIQTRNGVLHGARTVDSGDDFDSRPADTLDVSTRAYVDGVYWDGGVQSLYPQHTAWSG